MTDREKIIKELHDARRYLEDKEWSDRGASPHIDAINDALALLKEQGAEKPIAKEDDTFECCTCRAIVGRDELNASGIVQTRFNYCPFCGRPVKWE